MTKHQQGKWPAGAGAYESASRRNLLTRAALAPLLWPSIGQAETGGEFAVDVSHLSRFACTRTHEPGAKTDVQLLTIVGGHNKEAIRKEVLALNYGKNCMTTGHVTTLAWSGRDFEICDTANTGLMVCCDAAHTSISAAVEEATSWLSSGARVYLALPSELSAERLFIAAMSQLPGPWHVVRCWDLGATTARRKVVGDKSFISNLIRSVLDPQENYCLPCLDLADWNQVLGNRFIDAFFDSAPTFAVLEVRLRNALELGALRHPFVAVIAGPAEFTSLKLRFRLQDLLRKFAPLGGDFVFAANASEAYADYSIYLLRSWSFSR